MPDERQYINLAEELNRLEQRGKEPHSTKVLDSWIAHIENSLQADQGGRLSWLVASTLVTAKLQQVIDEAETSRFLLKGGSLLQHRLGGVARATKDVNGIVRGDIDEFLVDMDRAFVDPWGSITFERSEIEVIEVPTKIIKPRRLDVSLKLKGKTWRKVTVEISPDEGGATAAPELFSAPSLKGLGLPTPEYLVGLAMSYQIAQKIHAASERHEPPEFINERARDVVDLLLLRELMEKTGEPTNVAILSAIEDIFDTRANEARILGRQTRSWPARLHAFDHWQSDYATAAESAGIEMSLDDAIDQLNGWLDTQITCGTKDGNYEGQIQGS